MHFDIAVIIDCWDLTSSKDGLLTEPHEHKHLPNIMSGLTKLYLNFEYYFNPHTITYNFLVDATYPPWEPDGTLKKIFNLQPKHRLYTVVDRDKSNEISVGMVLEEFGLSGRQRVLIGGADLGACVLRRNLGVLQWIENGHDVFLHRKFSSITSENEFSITDKQIDGLNKDNGWYAKAGLRLVPYSMQPGTRTEFIKVVKIR